MMKNNIGLSLLNKETENEKLGKLYCTWFRGLWVYHSM